MKPRMKTYDCLDVSTARKRDCVQGHFRIMLRTAKNDFSTIIDPARQERLPGGGGYHGSLWKKSPVLGKVCDH